MDATRMALSVVTGSSADALCATYSVRYLRALRTLLRAGEETQAQRAEWLSRSLLAALSDRDSNTDSNVGEIWAARDAAESACEAFGLALITVGEALRLDAERARLSRTYSVREDREDAVPVYVYA